MASSSSLGSFEYFEFHFPEEKSVTLGSDLEFVNKQLDTLIQAIVTNQTSKSYVYTVELLKNCSFDILKNALETDTSGAINKQLKSTVNKIIALQGRIKNIIDRHDNLQYDLQRALPICKNNLIAAYNFHTHQVPVQLEHTGAWHGNAVMSDYLAQTPSSKTLDALLAERSARLIQRGQYLLRPSVSVINNQAEKIDFYVLEYRKNSDGNLIKFLFSYNHQTQKYCHERNNSKQELVKITSDVFEDFKAKLSLAHAQPVKVVEIAPSKSSRNILRCSQESDSSLDDPSSPVITV